MGVTGDRRGEGHGEDEFDRTDKGSPLDWPAEYDQVAAGPGLGWDERRKRYAWRRKLGESNRAIAKSEGYSISNARRLRRIVYEDLHVHSAAALSNELEKRMREIRRKRRGEE